MDDRSRIHRHRDLEHLDRAGFGVHLHLSHLDVVDLRNLGFALPRLFVQAGGALVLLRPLIARRFAGLNQFVVGLGPGLGHRRLQGGNRVQEGIAGHEGHPAARRGTHQDRLVRIPGVEPHLFQREPELMGGDLDEHGVVSFPGIRAGGVDGDAVIGFEFDRELRRIAGATDSEGKGGDSHAPLDLPGFGIECRGLPLCPFVGWLNGVADLDEGPLLDLHSRRLGLSRFQRVHPAEFQGIHPDLFRQHIQRRLRGKDRLRGTGAASRTAEGIVRVDVLAEGLDVRDVIGALHHHDGPAQNDRTVDRIGPLVHGEVKEQGVQTPVRIRCELHLHTGIGVPFRGDEHRFGHGGTVASGTVEVQGRRASDRLGDDPHLDAELPAGEGFPVAHLLVAQRLLELIEMEMDVDAPAHNDQFAVLPVAFEVGRGDLRLQGRLVDGLGRILTFIDIPGLLQGGFGVSFDERLGAADVVRCMGVDRIGTGGQGLFRGHHHRQRVVVHLNCRRGGPGLLPCLRGHGDNRIAEDPNLVLAKHRLVRVDLAKTVGPLDVLGP